jgi:hypothetical protein
MAKMEMNLTSKMTKAMEEMMKETVRECVTYLANEYSFDAEEALAKVSITCEIKKEVRAKKETKEKKEKFVKPAFVLPFCNAVMEGRCNGICLNNRLYTQCLKPAGENGLCAACNKQATTNDNGKPNFGLITDRIDNPEWTDPKGKAPVRYATVMLKQSIEKDAAVEEAAKFGWTIDEIQFEVEEKKEKKVAKRGRPAKTKNVETGGAGDDLIAQLVAQAQQEQAVDEEEESEEPEVVEEPKIVKKAPAKKSKKTAEEKEAEKQAKLKAKEAEKAAKEAEKAEKKAAKEAEKKAKEAEKKAKEAEKKAAKKAEKKAEEAVNTVDDDELHEEEEDETEVVKFEVDGTTYLKDNEGVLYDMESQEAVGVWNEETKKIDEIDEESEEEEDLE